MMTLIYLMSEDENRCMLSVGLSGFYLLVITYILSQINQYHTVLKLSYIIIYVLYSTMLPFRW